MKRHLDIVIPIIIIIAGALLMWALFTGQEIYRPSTLGDIYGPNKPTVIPQRPVTGGVPVVPALPSADITKIIQKSPEIFSFAHGTVMARGMIFVGMAARNGNPFPTNQLFVFTNPSDLKQVLIFSIPRNGDIESMVYDEKNDKVYFTLSNNGSLEIYRIDPRTFQISTIISTTTVNIGLKPAITTDGKFIYGISYTKPSTVFKVGIYGAPLEVSTIGHIPNGHSAAIGIYGSTTELYFGGGEADGFEKVDAVTLETLGTTNFPGCSITDDMPYEKMDDGAYGYVYVGCERVPFGYRVKTDDLSATQFSLPGKSFGMNIMKGDLYNAAQDGHYDIFKDMDIYSPKRYYVGQDIQLNELFLATTTTIATSTSMSTTTGAMVVSTTTTQSENLFFTGWWGVKGLFEAAKPVSL